MWVHATQAGSISHLFKPPSVFQESYTKFPCQGFVYFLLSSIFFVALEVGVPYDFNYLSFMYIYIKAVDFCVFTLGPANSVNPLCSSARVQAGVVGGGKQGKYD